MSELMVPRPLRKGDKVALISPSGPVMPERIDGAAAALRQWGFTPVEMPHCRGSFKDFDGIVSLSAPDGDRLSDVQAAFADPSVRAILCNRGGYGLVRLLNSLDLHAMARDPKWVIGFSDISALHAAMHRAGVMSIHAPMAKHLTEHGTQGEVSTMLHGIVTGGDFPHFTIEPSPFNRCGTATAPMTGGNLAVLSALIPTHYNLLEPGNILFIEDIAEEVYRVERMLHTLRLAGILPRLAGLVVGQFTNYFTTNPAGDGMSQMIARMVAPYKFPVAFNAPIGHVDRNLPIVEGAMTTLTVTPAGATVHQHK